MCSLFIGMVIITCFYYIVAGALLGGIILISLIVAGIVGLYKFFKSFS